MTYWLRGEEAGAAAERARRRSLRAHAAHAAHVAHAAHAAHAAGDVPPADRRGQRSSLKTRNWKNQLGGLHRCCSLESPKKLRFASGNHLESHTDSVLHHRSDEYLMEVVGEGRPASQRSDLLEAPSLRQEYTSVSCPIIEHVESSPAAPLGEQLDSKLGAPLDKLGEHLSAPADTACDIRFVVNGCTYDSDAAAIPLLADA
ncbi:hypothetical protein RR48_09039 [Papilio machaon]|uniref:Uncharacterized protein n=1 Tax=Papilio machaon TaxID=76193 RepID=A0A194RBM7_PAPMA|nr:hypothetical protein RR48_09039 [Papilio machaon]